MSNAALSDDAELYRRFEHGRTLFGPGWRCVESLDDIDDDEYEEEEEEEYVVMDLGTTMDTRALQTEATYQLIGMDTPVPFLKIGDNVFEGRVAPLIGDEVLFDVVRQEDAPQRPHHRPAYKTRHHIDFRGIKLQQRGMTDRGPQVAPKVAGSINRGMFPSRPRRLPKAEDEDGDKTPVAGPSESPARPQASPEVAAKPRSEETPVPESTAPGTVPNPRTPAKDSTVAEGTLEGTPLGETSTPRIHESPTRAGPGRGRGRGRSSTTRVRASIAVSSLADLADIAFAGGLGEARLDVAPNADQDLLDAVAAVRRGKQWTPGSRLTPAQEERLLRNLPASGPGSRGGTGRGRGSPARGRGGRGRGGRRGQVDASGEGLGAQLFGFTGGDTGNPQRNDETEEQGGAESAQGGDTSAGALQTGDRPEADPSSDAKRQNEDASNDE